LGRSNTFTSILCPDRSTAIVDPDDNNNSQNISSGIIVAVVYCLVADSANDVNDNDNNIKSVNEALLEAKLAAIDYGGCVVYAFKIFPMTNKSLGNFQTKVCYYYLAFMLELSPCFV
jgi:hypothetical protein